MSLSVCWLSRDRALIRFQWGRLWLKWLLVMFIYSNPPPPLRFSHEANFACPDCLERHRRPWERRGPALDMQVCCVAVRFPNGDVHCDGTQTDNWYYFSAHATWRWIFTKRECLFVREKGFLGSVGQFLKRLLRWKEFVIIGVHHCCYYKSTILIKSIGYLFNESL